MNHTDTTTGTTATETPVATGTTTAQRTRRGALLLRLVVALAIVLAGVGLPGEDRAEAAAFSTPTMSCGFGDIRLDPGVQATYGQTDGYWIGWLFRYDGQGSWHYTGQMRQGRESVNTASVGGNTFSGLERGYYAILVQRYNRTSSGSWNQLGNTLALEAVSVATGGSAWWCLA